MRGKDVWSTWKRNSHTHRVAHTMLSALQRSIQHRLSRQ